MFPKVDKTLDLSSILAIINHLFIALLAQALWTCHRHKNTLGSRSNVATNASMKIKGYGLTNKYPSTRD
jgi:hypothetical protein